MAASGNAAAPAPRVKRNIASLVGGFVIAIGVFVLWLLVGTHLTGTPPGAALIASGVLVAATIGVWIRLADL